MKPNRVDVPQFELVGPPCEAPGCSGVLVLTTCLRTKDVFKQCSKCRSEFYRMTGQEALAWTKRTFARVLKGEKLD